MKASVLAKKPKNLTQFQKEQWEIADTSHYGRPGKWKKIHRFILIHEEDRIVGHAEILIMEGVCEVKELLTHNAHQRRGIGRKLVETVEEFARKRGVHKIYLLTGEGWDSEKFYRALGYKKDADVPRHYLLRNFVTYSKYLDGTYEF